MEVERDVVLIAHAGRVFGGVSNDSNVTCFSF